MIKGFIENKHAPNGIIKLNYNLDFLEITPDGSVYVNGTLVVKNRQLYVILYNTLRAFGEYEQKERIKLSQ